MAERRQSSRFAIDRMQRCEHVDHHVPDACEQRRIALIAIGHRATNHLSYAPLHHLERSADDGFVIAEQVAAWRELEVGV